VSRIYIVATRKTGKTRLVRANTMLQALRFVAAESFIVKAASHDQIFEIMKAGTPIVNAVDQEQTEIGQGEAT
jgi:hypothetical protein